MEPRYAIPEIILVDKPSGISSFDVIRRLRRTFGLARTDPAWRMGHAGTLDPLASGLMVVGIGPGTKRLNEYLKLPKTYEADILLGVRTATGDTEGDVIEERDASGLGEETIRDAVARLRGTRAIRAPLYSALKLKGRPLYAYARTGRTDVVPPEREMRVDRAETTNVVREGGHVVVSVTFDVGSGTYIRSLAEELGRGLGVPATLRALRRTRIGDFRIEDAELLRP